ncbi:MAG: hypothetical protein NVS3B14_09240 [Ktedonobacteraceae bacterium]
MTWIRTHLSEMPYLLMLHFTNMWIPYTYSHGLPMEEFPHRQSSKFLSQLIPLESVPIFVLAASGLVLTWIKRKKLLVIYLVGLSIIGQNIIFYSNMRFRAPIEPFLVLLTGGVLWWLSSHQPGTVYALYRRFTGKAVSQDLSEDRPFVAEDEGIHVDT